MEIRKDKTENLTYNLILTKGKFAIYRQDNDRNENKFVVHELVDKNNVPAVSNGKPGRTKDFSIILFSTDSEQRAFEKVDELIRITDRDDSEMQERRKKLSMYKDTKFFL